MKRDEGVAPRTLDGYQSSLKCHLRPCLGKTKLEKINQAHARKLINLGRKKGAGAVRINFQLRVLKQMLGDGVKLNYLIRNPLTGFKSLKVPPRALRYWLPEQVERFLQANRNDPYYPLYVLALNTGLRRGELLGLCWDKVDLKARRLEISRIRDRYGLKDTTKTGAVRHVLLNDGPSGVGGPGHGKGERELCLRL